MLTQDIYTESHRIFSYDAETGFLTRRVPVLNRHGTQNDKPKCKVGDVAGSNNAQGYLHVRVYGKQYRAHRIIWLMQFGHFPAVWLDHINGDRADNRLCNLREANMSENGCNRLAQSNSTTGYKGVNYAGRGRKKPYRAQIGLNGKQFYIGHFLTAELAYEAYCNAAKEIHGEFAHSRRSTTPAE